MLFQAEANGDVETVLSLFSDDATLALPVGTVFGGEWVGRERIRDAFALLGETYPQGLDVSSSTITAAGDKIFAELEWTAVTADGIRIDDREVFVFELDDRRIKRARAYSMGGEFVGLGAAPTTTATGSAGAQRGA